MSEFQIITDGDRLFVHLHESKTTYIHELSNDELLALREELRSAPTRFEFDENDDSDDTDDTNTH
jgi:hypothetical protein